MQQQASLGHAFNARGGASTGVLFPSRACMPAIRSARLKLHRYHHDDDRSCRASCIVRRAPCISASFWSALASATHLAIHRHDVLVTSVSAFKFECRANIYTQSHGSQVVVHAKQTASKNVKTSSRLPSREARPPSKRDPPTRLVVSTQNRPKLQRRPWESNKKPRAQIDDVDVMDCGSGWLASKLGQWSQS